MAGNRIPESVQEIDKRLLAQRTDVKVSNGHNVAIDLSVGTLCEAAKFAGKKAIIPIGSNSRRMAKLKMRALPTLKRVLRWAQNEDRIFNEATVIAYIRAHS